MLPQVTHHTLPPGALAEGNVGVELVLVGQDACAGTSAATQQERSDRADSTRHIHIEARSHGPNVSSGHAIPATMQCIPHLSQPRPTLCTPV